MSFLYYESIYVLGIKKNYNKLCLYVYTGYTWYKKINYLTANKEKSKLNDMQSATPLLVVG